MNTKKLSSHVSLIWNIAEILRGDYKEHEYGDVVLPFTVLTRLDSVLVDTKQAVLDIKATSAHEKVKELQYAKATGYPFWNTSNFTLKTLLDDADHLKENLAYYVRAFAPAAHEVMEAYNFYNVIERLDKADLLYHVLSEFTSAKVNLHPDVVSNDQMGYIFEELIRRFSELSNETAGEHFTPREVISLMVNLLFSPEEDINRLCADGAMASLYDPGVGTGGMLSIAAQHIEDLNNTARLEVYGQELNPQTYAVAKSDIMIKGERQERIYLGNSLTNDKTAGLQFDYMLCNPPFGVNWKKYAGPILEEAERMGYRGRFGAGTPRVADGSFLFLQHMISKMKPYDPEDLVNAPGTRIGIVFNGSSLFTGGAGQGESEIRRWILENDWLEAIIALPDQMFYNTGILTYIWVLSNKKERRRKNKVQLIDATSYFRRMRKPLGEKRKELTDDNIAEITRIYGAFQETEHSKIFNIEDFAYQEVVVDRPLRLSFQATRESIEALLYAKPFADLATSKKRTEPARTEEIEVGKRVQKVIIDTLEALNAERVYLNRDDFTDLLREGIKDRGEKIGIAVLRKIVTALGTRNPDADICVDAKGNPEPDTDLRDTEQIPFREDIDAYFQREVIPYAPDAWIDYSKTKVGYEIPFTRYFFKHEEVGDPVETLTEIQALSANIQATISKLFSEQERYRRELIAHTVTRGLDPDTPMRESGINWIGEIPEAWTEVSLKSLLRRVSVKNKPKRRVLSVERSKGVVDRETEGSPDNRNRLPDDLSGYLAVDRGQFVMNKMKAWQGSYGVSKMNGITSPAYYVFDLKFANTEYFNWAIRSQAYVPFFGRDSYGIRTDQWDFKIAALSSIPFYVPSDDEQSKIVAFLEAKTAAIDSAMADIVKQIELLGKYRKQVINDAVTGKSRGEEVV